MTDEANELARKSGEVVADEVEQQRQQQGDGTNDGELVEGDGDDIPF